MSLGQGEQVSRVWGPKEVNSHSQEEEDRRQGAGGQETVFNRDRVSVWEDDKHSGDDSGDGFTTA